MLYVIYKSNIYFNRSTLVNAIEYRKEKYIKAFLSQNLVVLNPIPYKDLDEILREFKVSDSARSIACTMLRWCKLKLLLLSRSSCSRRR